MLLLHSRGPTYLSVYFICLPHPQPLPGRYVDVILRVIELAGDFVSDDIWFRVVHFVTNHEELQSYSAERVLSCLRQPAVHENMVKV